MPQAKKKTSTKTAVKKQTYTTKKCTKTSCNKKANKNEKFHVYIITALSMITAILLCADAVFMMV